MTPTKVKSSPIYGIDILRVASATIVMVYHFTFWHWTRGQSVLKSIAKFRYPSLISWDFGWVGVEIFFVISGLVISRSINNNSPKEFIISRVRRLVPGVWVCATYTLLIFVFILHFNFSQTFRAYLGSLFFWPFLSIDGVYWTLGIEISFYALMYFLIRARRVENIEAVVVMFGAVSGAFWVFALGLATFTHGATGTGGLVQMLVLKAEGNRILQLALIPHGCLFALGVVLDRAASDGQWSRRLLVLIALAAACALEIVGQNSIITRASGISLSPLPALLVWSSAAALVVASLLLNGRVSRFVFPIRQQIATFGKLTYPLYLTHNSTVFLTVAVLGDAIGSWSIPAGMVGAFLVAFLIQAGPEKWLRQILDRVLAVP